MDMKKLLATAHAAGYAMALPEDFDAGVDDAAASPPDDVMMEQAVIPSRALVLTPPPPRASSLRDWIAGLWVGRTATLS